MKKAEVSTPSKTYQKRAKRGRPKSLKSCCECGEVKPLSEYHVNNTNIDGRQGRCKACVNARNRGRFDKSNAGSGGLVVVQRYREGTSRTHSPGELCRWPGVR
ncbi:MAG: hypothetical protein KJ731_01010 [Alphaproteobacteria bacterium]|nr:hypothetical protein [Alphaproteobacteria bacterium]